MLQNAKLLQRERIYRNKCLPERRNKYRIYWDKKSTFC